MNQFALNGATLNGLDGIPLTAGNVSLLATSLVLANPTLVQAASTNTSAAASISVGVNAIARVIAGASAQLQVGSQITLVPTHSQAANASLFAIAQVSSYVLRNVTATANVQVQALVVAIPASTLAHASLAVQANVSAQASRIQRASANLSANAEALATSVVRRNAFAALMASANSRVEASLKHAGVNRHDGFADIATLVRFEVQDVGIVQRLATSDVQGQALCSAQAQKVQTAFASVLGAALLDAQPLVIKNLQAKDVLGVQGWAEVSAQAIRTLAGSASVQITSGGTALARQSMLAAASAENRVSMDASATRWLYPIVECPTKASVAAEASRTRLADVNLVVTALLSPDAAVNVASTGHFTLGISEVSAKALIYRMAASASNPNVELVARAIVIRQATAVQTGMAIMSANADIKRAGWLNVSARAQVSSSADVKRFVAATIKGSSELIAQAQSYSMLRMASAVIVCGAECQIDALCVRPVFAHLAACGELNAVASASEHYYGEAALEAICTIAANASTNPAAFDPPERTMIRPFLEREMLRPFTNREMQR